MFFLYFKSSNYMAFGLNRRLLNFLMSGPFFDDKKTKSKKNKHTNWNDNSNQNNNTQWNVYETKMDYVSKVASFLEDWVKEMKKDIKKL